VKNDSEKSGSGIAGNSARNRSEKKFKNPNYGRSWEKGAIGEEGAGKVIEDFCAKYSFKFLHDRKIPGTKANIDHILITDRGIFVVDTKNYRGAVRIKESGGLFLPHKETLFVGNRNQTKLVMGVKKQIELVSEAFLQGGSKLPIFGVLAFFKADFPIFNAEYLVEDEFSYPISINGKHRMNLTFSLQATVQEIEATVLANESVQKWLEGKSPKKVIFVKGKIVNLVC
jgi:hypothetical protein